MDKIIVQNDQGILMEVQLKDEKHIPIDLTGNTVDAEVLFPDGGKHVYHCSITDPVNGMINYTVNSDMTASLGVYKLRYVILNNGLNVTSTSNDYYVVIEDWH